MISPSTAIRQPKQARSLPIVHILDDDDLVCRVLGALVERTGCPWTSHRSSEDFLDDFDPTGPACLLLDVVLPGMSGLDLLVELESRGLMLPTLVLSADSDIERVVTAVQRGAIGFLTKPPDPRRFLEHIEFMIGKAEPMAEERRLASAVRTAVDTLTPRELEVFSLLLEGQSAKQIAHSLRMSPRTAHIHRINVMRKLQVETVFELIRRVGSFRSPRTD